MRKPTDYRLMTPPPGTEKSEVQKRLDRWVRARAAVLLPMIKSARYVTLWVRESELDDPSLALTLGLTVLLGKPLLILALEGCRVPASLRRIADEIVEGSSMDDPQTLAKMLAANERIETKLDAN